MNEAIPQWAAELSVKLDRIEALLASKPKERTYENLIPIAEFCARLGRTRWWGYDQIKRRSIIPAKTGKPFLIPIEQLENFMPTAKRAAIYRT